MKMGKQTKNKIVKLAVVVTMLLGSGLSVYGYAESVKDAQLKEQLTSQQKTLGKSLETLYYEKLDHSLSVEEAQAAIEQYTLKLKSIEAKKKTLTNKNAEKISEQSKELAEALNVIYALTRIYAVQNNLFEMDILTTKGLNKEAKLKETVTLARIDDVAEEIKRNPQADIVMEETTTVLDFARQQLKTKEAVDTWLAKNEKQYSEKNYQTLKELVEQVIPEPVKETYKKPLDVFKQGLDKKVAQEKAAKEKLAKEKAAKEQAAKEAKAAEQERVAMKQTTPANTNQGASDQGSQTNAQSNTGGSQVPDQAPVANNPAPAPAPTPEVRTDGFNFKGYHFDISSFSGLGAVPQWTPYVYQWSDDPSHYLIEKASSAGSAVWNLGVGDKVVINGQTYTIFNMMRHVANDDNAYGILKSQGATVTWQTCETASSNSALAIWFAY